MLAAYRPHADAVARFLGISEADARDRSASLAQHLGLPTLVGLKDAPPMESTARSSPRETVVVLERLGRSLDVVLDRYGSLDARSVAAVGASVLRTLRVLHENPTWPCCHGDVKPGNILLPRAAHRGSGAPTPTGARAASPVGSPRAERRRPEVPWPSDDIDVAAPAFLVDFGLVHRYRDWRGRHVAYERREDWFDGSPEFAARTAHAGAIDVRRDDVESLALTLFTLEFGLDALPWVERADGTVAAGRSMEWVAREKERFAASCVAGDEPGIGAAVMAYVDSLSYADEVDYDALTALLRRHYRAGGGDDSAASGPGVAVHHCDWSVAMLVLLSVAMAVAGAAFASAPSPS